ncbi:MAG: hypothetical protein K2N53_05625 [Clostridia bacterium]|nr:hypothetical protein [Clostridia bacterium]
MKYAVIDVGSNSVRLMVSEELERIYKKINTTRLGMGLALTGRLDGDRMAETAAAVEQFVQEAKAEQCEEIFVFATEAVRSATNREEFVTLLADKGIDIEVVDSEDEAKLGFAGAYTQGVCCVLDIGGGSAELAVGDSDGLSYAKSLPIGLMRIYDKCQEDIEAIDAYVADTIRQYGKTPDFDNLLAIGGTATTFVAIKEKMTHYDPNVVDGYVLTKSDIEEMTERIRLMSMQDRLLLPGLEPKRANVIVGGGRLLSAIMDMLDRDSLVVRESDNQEGFLYVRLKERLGKSKMHLFRQYST